MPLPASTLWTRHLLFLLVVWSVAPLAAAPQPAPTISAHTRAVLFASLEDSFWAIEWRIHPPAPERNGSHSSLELEPWLRAPYARCITLARRLLQARPPLTDAHRADALYIAAMCASTFGRDAEAVDFLSRLLQEFPHYYAPSRTANQTLHARPAAFDLGHLLLWHQSRLLQTAPKPAPPKAALEALRAFTATAVQSVQGEADWKQFVQHDIASQITDESRRLRAYAWLDSNCFYTPEQARAAHLPPVADLLETVFTALMPSALQQSGVGPVRRFLNELAQPDQPFVTLAKFHLGELDKVLIAQLQNEATKAEGASQWDKAKGIYTRLIADFPDNPVAAWAKGKLAALHTRLARQYLDQAKPLMISTDTKTAPYAQAKPLLEKSIAEDPGGPTSAEAMLALAKVQLNLDQKDAALRTLDRLAARSPNSPEAMQAQYQKALTMLWFHVKPEEILRIFQQAAQTPGFDKPDEAMYLTMYMQWVLQRHNEALKTLEAFLAKYPNSPYARPAKLDLPLLKKRIEEVKAGINLHPTTGFESYTNH
jgi:outer membrane protein assembly factor BamD (BamD/ComL family)